MKLINLINLILSLLIINSNFIDAIKKFNFTNKYNNFTIKLIKNGLNIIKTEKIKFSKICPYEFDSVWSIGMNCRPAYYIEKYNLRFQAAPFDWMMKYSLQEIINQIKSKFENFFSNIEDITPKNSKSDHRKIKDKVGKTVSIHHFPGNVSAENYKKTFRNMMIKRANRMDSIIKSSKNIGFIYESEVNNLNEVINFGKQISQIYENLEKIVIFHIVNSKDENLKEATKTIFGRVTIVSIKLNDINDKDRTDWRGNPDKWKNYVMKFIFPSKILKQSILNASLNKKNKIENK